DASGPPLDLPGQVLVLRDQHLTQGGSIGLGISEWIAVCMRGHFENRPCGRSLVYNHISGDGQLVRSLRENGRRNQVSEDVLRPLDVCRRRCADPRPPQIEVVTASGCQHQTMRQQSDRLVIPIDRRVLDTEQHIRASSSSKGHLFRETYSPAASAACLARLASAIACCRLV